MTLSSGGTSNGHAGSKSSFLKCAIIYERRDGALGSFWRQASSPASGTADGCEKCDTLPAGVSPVVDGVGCVNNGFKISRRSWNKVSASGGGRVSSNSGGGVKAVRARIAAGVGERVSACWVRGGRRASAIR